MTAIALLKAKESAILNLITVIAFSKTKMIAVLKFNQQDNGNLTFKSPSNRTFTSQSDRVLNFEFM
jgi:hypothetical protein